MIRWQQLMLFVLLNVAYSIQDQCNGVHSRDKVNKGPKCPAEGFHKEGVTEKEKRLIVATHNKLRNELASGQTKYPQASNMFELKWDDGLARMAQNHARQCVFEHDEGGCRTDERFEVGQNVAFSSLTGHEKGSITDYESEWEAHLNSFWDENEDYPADGMSSYRNVDALVTHFSQMAWWSVRYVGCGYTSFPIDDGKGVYKLYVCDYGSNDSANILEKPVYQTGTPCSACGGTCSSQYSALCPHDATVSDVSVGGEKTDDGNGPEVSVSEQKTDDGCQDNDEYKDACPYWASEGHCNSTPEFMNQECCKSCQSS